MEPSSGSEETPLTPRPESEGSLGQFSGRFSDDLSEENRRSNSQRFSDDLSGDNLWPPHSQPSAPFRPPERLVGSPLSVANRLFENPCVFDFFQAMRILEILMPDRAPLGLPPSPQQEIARVCVHSSLDFPASAIQEIQFSEDLPVPRVFVNFMGLTGAVGVLPLHYTETLLQVQRDGDAPEKYALRDWLDAFNHRLISLMYQAWKKYRFYVSFARGESSHPEPDQFTRTLSSMIGMGTSGLRDRLRVGCRDENAPNGVRTLAQVDDTSLFRFGGFLAHRPRNAISLQVLLSEYFRVPVEIIQFSGQWLKLGGGNLSALGNSRRNNAMGLNAMIGDKIWDIQSKIRIRIGPLTYEQFVRFLPDTSPRPESKSIFLLARLVRLYLGLEFDVDAQLVLKAEEVPVCRMGKSADGGNSRIGWTSWMRSQDMTHDVDQAVFEVQSIQMMPG
ncbi:MAG: type VI secretion system baseplate subunit TssG [Gemmataceae bacterium]